MNDERRLEHEIRSLFADSAPQRVPEYLLPSIVHQASHKRRHPRWLALIKEPSMRIDSRLAVGSPTARVAAVMVATILITIAIAGAGIAGSRLLAADGLIIVDLAGGGTATTITEAVAMATDGDEILIKPGTYAESVTIDKDITIRGEDRGSVIIEFGGGCPEAELTCSPETPTYPFWYGVGPYGVLLRDSNARISDLTVRGIGGSWTGSLVAAGGAPMVSGIRADDPLYIDQGSKATITDSDLSDAWVFFEGQSPATIEDSSFLAIVANGNSFPNGAAATIRNNRAAGITFHGPALVQGNTLTAPPEPVDGLLGWAGIHPKGDGGWTVEDNTISGFGSPEAGIMISGTSGTVTDNHLDDNTVGISASGSDSVIENNDIRGGTTGIQVSTGSPTVTDNHLDDNTVGISASGSDSVIENNDISGGTSGIVVSTGSPTLRTNTVEGAERGLVIGAGATPILKGNTLCGNVTNLDVNEQADVPETAGNEICEDTPAD